MRYNKLVRDKIPEIIRQKGGTPVTHVAAMDEYRAKLLEKLQEEAGEFLKEPSKEELVDILEIVFAIGKLLGLPPEELEALRAKRAEERGAFREKIILEEVQDRPET